jgi:hypothetical protein
VPADGLLHPAAIGALGLLVLNDHVLKAAWPGIVTGKLSDAAGLVLLPLVVQAGWELARSVIGRDWGPSPRVLVAAVVITGLGFALAKTLEPAADAYRIGFGILQWPAAALLAVVRSAPIPDAFPVAFVRDPGDLVTLAALLIPFVVGRRRVDPHERRPDEPQADAPDQHDHHRDDREHPELDRGSQESILLHRAAPAPSAGHANVPKEPPSDR